MTAAERGPRVPSRSRSWFRRRCSHPSRRPLPTGARPSACLYGRLQVTIGGARVATKVRGDGIGEIALLYAVPRTATVTAESPATAFALDRATFLEAVAGHAHTAQAAAAIANERLDQDRRRQSPKPDDGQPDSASA